MSFEKGRKLSKYLVFAGAALLIVSVLIEKDFPATATYMTWAAVLVFVCGVIATLVLCRCPYCGKTILVGALTRKDCPRCHKPLVSRGKKMNNSLREKGR